MFVCICNAVKEKHILEAIAQGDDTLEKLQASLDVATCCGGCQPMIEGYLEEAKSSQVVIAHLPEPRVEQRIEPRIDKVATVELFIPSASSNANISASALAVA